MEQLISVERIFHQHFQQNVKLQHQCNLILKRGSRTEFAVIGPLDVLDVIFLSKCHLKKRQVEQVQKNWH